MTKLRELFRPLVVLPTLIVAGSALVGCAPNAALTTSDDDDGESVGTVQSQLTTVDPRRSLVVTDLAILNRFSLFEVLQRLATNAGSTQTPAQILLDFAANRGGCGTFNGFLDPCTRNTTSINTNAAEDERATTDPTLAFYKPIALTNRFDLASANGADCGEYRVAFNALASNGRGATFVIFEARLPNPTPQLGREGCRPVAQFWANLSTQTDVNLRADALHNFYFSGLPGFTPVVDVSHYAGGDHASGQIRLNARIDKDAGPWVFMEFRTGVACGAACSVNLIRSTTKSVPFPALAGDVAAQPLASAFQNALVGSLTAGSGLLANRLSDLSSNLSDSFNIGHESTDPATTVPGPIVQAASPQFNTAIQSRLTALGSPLTPTQVLHRTHSLTCGGCHNFESSTANELGGLASPSLSLNGNPEMLSTNQEAGPDGQRYFVKHNLANVFMPERLASFSQFVNSRSISNNLEAEANDGQSGVQLEACADTGGGQNAGFIGDGSSLQWSVHVPTSGNYALTTRSATWAAASLQVLVDGVVVSPLSMTSSWNGTGAQYQTWKSFTSGTFALTAGVHTLKVQFTSGNQNLNWVKLNAVTQAPTCGNGVVETGEACDDGNTVNTDACTNACALPACGDAVCSASELCSSCGTDCGACNSGRNISNNLEAESNDGQSGVQFQACADTGGGQNAGFISNGSFIQWTVNVPTAGSYALTTRSATWAGASLQVLLDGTAMSTLNLTSTWNGAGAQYQTWANFTTGAFNLTAGTHALKVLFTSGNQNLNYVRLQPQTATNLVQNGSFAAGSSNWVTFLSGATVTYAAGFGDFTINTVSTNSWDVQLTQGLALTSGTVYTLCYDVKSNEAARTIRVSTDGDADSSYANRGLDVSGVSVTTGWLTRSHTFTANQSDGTSRVAFDFGQNANNIQIDNVKLFAGTTCQ